jgi:hypothetical protein
VPSVATLPRVQAAWRQLYCENAPSSNPTGYWAKLNENLTAPNGLEFTVGITGMRKPFRLLNYRGHHPKPGFIGFSRAILVGQRHPITEQNTKQTQRSMENPWTFSAPVPAASRFDCGQIVESRSCRSSTKSECILAFATAGSLAECWDCPGDAIPRKLNLLSQLERYFLHGNPARHAAGSIIYEPPSNASFKRPGCATSCHSPHFATGALRRAQTPIFLIPSCGQQAGTGPPGSSPLTPSAPASS